MPLSPPLQALSSALDIAIPRLVKFFLCAGILFVAFMLCGWVVLGPFHYKVSGRVCGGEDVWMGKVWVGRCVGGKVCGWEGVGGKVCEWEGVKVCGWEDVDGKVCGWEGVWGEGVWMGV